MRWIARRLALVVLVSLTPAMGWGAPPPPTVTPSAILAAAPAGDWTSIPPGDLLVVDLQGGQRFVIELADRFAPLHLANIRRLAQAHWYDGVVIERVQDNYVAQWGDPDGKKDLPPGLVRPPPAEYDRPAADLPFTPVPYPDTYATMVGISGAFPAAQSEGRAWLAHCYSMVGVGRDLAPDTGTGAELYAVIGQPIRSLDRNIAVIGRVISGIETLSALPRGTGDLGFYTEPNQRLSIRQVRLAIDLPPDQQPHFERLRPESATYSAWVHARANRQDSFFVRPAGAVDVCNVLPPVRSAS